MRMGHPKVSVRGLVAGRLPGLYPHLPRLKVLEWLSVLPADAALNFQTSSDPECQE